MSERRRRSLMSSMGFLKLVSIKCFGTRVLSGMRWMLSASYSFLMPRMPFVTPPSSVRCCDRDAFRTRSTSFALSRSSVSAPTRS